jgi:hypothetical protein
MKLSGNVQGLIVLLFILILLEGGSAGFNLLSSSSYSTGYEGAHAQFAGIRWQDQQYEGLGFDTTMHFDPDDALTGMCDLEGEMTSVFIPSESLSNMPSWIPLDWVRETSYIQNPVKEPYTWEIGNLTYTMEEWKLRWYFSISAGWSEPPTWTMLKDTEKTTRRYTECEIWFEFDLTPVWYFEGTDRAYFAIAKMQVADVELEALDNDGNKVEPSLETSVSPESQGSILPIYYGKFAQQNPADKDAMDYQGKQLNPDLFTSKAYTYFRLNNFGVTDWLETGAFLLPVHKLKGDVVTVSVDVTVFVIGEWTVQDIESIENIEGDTGYGRTAQLGTGGWTWETFLSSPFNRALLVGIAGLALFIILIIAFPSVIATLALLIQALTGGRKR